MSAAATPIRAFLFDIGNVLLRFDFAHALRALAAHCDEEEPTAVLARLEDVKLAYEDGQIDRASFLRAAFQALRYRGLEPDFIRAWEEIFEPNEPMIALVEQLHGRFPLYLLSNTSDIHRDYVFRQYPFFARFSGGVYSYLARRSKPGREIFEHAARELGLTPETTFFIDDLQANIATAQALGYICHHYHHERHDALLADLRAHGVAVSGSSDPSVADQ